MASRPVSAHAAVPDADGPDSVSRVDKRPLPEPSESGPAPKLHRPRASRACESCHARKVRCDVVLSNPCTNCRLDRVACVEREKKKPPQKHSPPAAENGDRPPETSPRKPSITSPIDTTRPPSKYKLPAFIQPLPSRLTSSDSDMDYLYSRGAFVLPPVHLQNILVQAYIESIYPYMPSIDLHDFLHIIDNRDGSAGRVSLLLYQAVMFAATAFIDSRDLIDAGYSSRKEMRKYYFGRVRMLYDFDCEPNRFVVVQGLILMTYWHDTPDGQKDMWYWQGLAVNTAYTIDLQRDPAAMGIDPERAKLWKRVWWSCFMRDRFIGLCMRKPAKIWEEDSDMPMLEESDFEVMPLSEGNSSVSPSCTLIRDTDTQRVLARQCISTVKLCVVVGRILKTMYTVDLRNASLPDNTEESTMFVRPNQRNAPSEEVLDGFQAELDAWLADLPPDCQPKPLTEDDTIPPHNIVAIHRSVLTLGLHAATLALQRPSMMSKGRDPARQQASLARIRNAAAQTALIAGDVYKLQLDMFMPAVTAILLLPSATVHLEQLGSLDFAKRAEAARAFVNCMLVTQTLRQAFYGADFIMLQLGGALERMHVDTSQYAADPEVVDMLERMTSAAPIINDPVMDPFFLASVSGGTATDDNAITSEDVMVAGVDPLMSQRFADDVVHVDLTTLLLQLVDQAPVTYNPPWDEQTYI